MLALDRQKFPGSTGERTYSCATTLSMPVISDTSRIVTLLFRTGLTKKVESRTSLACEPSDERC